MNKNSAGTKRVQQLLNSRLKPSPMLKVDGVWGSKTEHAVRLFQHVYGLSVDGVVGPLTLKVFETGAVTPSAKHFFY